MKINTLGFSLAERVPFSAAGSGLAWMAPLILMGLVSQVAAGAEPQSRTTIRGELKADAACGDEPFQVWLAKEKTLVQQLEIPGGGTFLVDVVPGDYWILAKNQNECLVRTEVKADAGHEARVKLEAAMSKRKPAGEQLVRPSCLCVQARGCPCSDSMDGALSGVFTPPGYINLSYMTWWMPNSVLFNSFFAPGAMRRTGLDRRVYPGAGDMTMYKPVVYMSGEPETKVKMEVAWTDPMTSWIATVPAYGANGWSVTLQKDDILLSDSVKYRYFFYDLRTDSKLLQKERGFCGTRTEALQKMAKSLEVLGFKKAEVRDFNEYWQVKMGPNDVCVFPQGNAELDRVARLQISPAPKRVVRVLFVVADKKGMEEGRTAKFVKAPTKEWVAPVMKRLPSSQSFEVREWGVGYTFDPPESPDAEK